MNTITLTELRAKHQDVMAKFGKDVKLTLTRYGKPIANIVLVDDTELQKIEAQELTVNVIK